MGTEKEPNAPASPPAEPAGAPRPPLPQPPPFRRGPVPDGDKFPDDLYPLW